MPTPRVTPEEEIANPHPVGTQEWDEWEYNHPKQPPQTGGIGKENGTMAAAGVQQNVNMGDGETKHTSSTSTDAKENIYSEYDDILTMMQDAQKRTKEDEELARRQERLARAHSFTSGIGDLGRAIANLYYTNQYAPNGYDHDKDSLSEKAKARADKWRAERQRLQKEYYNYAMQGANAKNSREAFKAQQERYRQQQSNTERQLANRERELDMRQAKMEMDEAEFEWKKIYQQKGLDLKDKIAKMNNETRRWAKMMGVKQAQINHNLAGYVLNEEYIFNNRGKKIGRRVTRTVVNPKTGEIDVETKDEMNGVGTSVGGGGTSTPWTGGSSNRQGDKSTPWVK